MSIHIQAASDRPSSSIVQLRPQELAQRVIKAVQNAFWKGISCIGYSASLIGRVIQQSAQAILMGIKIFRMTIICLIFGRLALDFAAANGYIDVVRRLLASGSISNLDRGTAITSAAEKGYIEIVRLLLASGAISDDDRGWAVRCAARKGHIEIVRLLLANGSIGNSHRSFAIENAITNGYLAIVQLLLPQNIRLSQIEREWLVLFAVGMGRSDAVEFLLQQGPISASARDSSITQARGPLAGQIRDLLMMAPVIPDAQIPLAGATAHDQDPDVLYICLNDVKKDPAHFLELVTNKFPRRVVLVDNPQAIDLGGVTKQFITTLINALVDKEVIGRNDQLLPMIRSDEDVPHMQNLGKFYSAIFEKNKDRTDKFVIGNLFHLRFFQLVKIAISSAPEQDKLKSVATIVAQIDPCLKTAADVLTNPNAENAQAYCTLMGIAKVEEADPKDQFEGFLSAAVAFSQGLKPEFKTHMLAQPSIALMTAMQGEPITVQKLLNAINFEGTSAGFIQKKNWIVEKIREGDVNWMKKFLLSITGSTTLSSTACIRIETGWREAFEIHTCANSLDVPSVAMSKERFITALDAAITGQGYNIA